MWRHRLGTPRSDDVCVFDETDERFFVAIGSTRSEAWIVIHSASRTTADARIISTDQPDRRSRRRGAATRRRRVRHRPLGRLVRDAHQRRCGRLPTARRRRRRRHDRPDRPGPSLVAHEPGRRILGADAFEDHLVIHEWVDAQPRLRILFRDRTERDHRPRNRTARRRADDQPAVGDRAGALHRAVVDARRRRSTTSTSPPANATLLRQIPTPNVDLDSYTAERVWADAADGTARADRHRAPRRHARSTARRPACSTATAPTRRRCRRGSRWPDCRCSTAATSGRSPIPAVAASSAGTGISTASCSPSPTRSAT